MEAKLYQQDKGISIYMSSGRFDIQFHIKKLSEMMTKPRKMGNLRPARLATYLVKKLPLKPTNCRRFLGLIARANGGSVVDAQMSGNEGS